MRDNLRAHMRSGLRGDLRPKRANFGPERGYFGSERDDFRPESARLGPESSQGGDGDIRTDGRMDGRKEIYPCVLQDIGPWGPLPKKLQMTRGYNLVADRWAVAYYPQHTQEQKCVSRLFVSIITDQWQWTD